MDEFKERWIINEMLATEKEQNSQVEKRRRWGNRMNQVGSNIVFLLHRFDRFLLYMDAQQTGPVFSYLNKEGCIPPEAILTF